MFWDCWKFSRTTWSLLWQMWSFLGLLVGCQLFWKDGYTVSISLFVFEGSFLGLQEAFLGSGIARSSLGTLWSSLGLLVGYQMFLKVYCFYYVIFCLNEAFGLQEVFWDFRKLFWDACVEENFTFALSIQVDIADEVCAHKFCFSKTRLTFSIIKNYSKANNNKMHSSPSA